MPTFDELIATEIAMLKFKGYSEKGLHAFSNPGDYHRRLSELVSTTMASLHKDDEFKRLSFPVYGYFRDDQDVVRFSFKFKVGPRYPFIYQEELSARLGDIGTQYDIADPFKNLKRPTAIHEELLGRQRFMQQIQQFTRSVRDYPEPAVRDDLDQMAAEQREALQKAGYLPVFPSPQTERFEHLLREQLLTGIEHHPDKHHLFVLRLDQKKSPTGYPLRARFAFRFIPTEMTLSLEGLHGQTGPHMRAYSFPGNTDPPSVFNVSMDLHLDRAMEKAQQLVNRQPPKGGLRLS
ncbi:hypothetical protein [Dinghuibacter silviterrae]|uniref:Uncharacterized protein n=1 Tax=Dinghuibacter silviterrae TaxID=1539049 RepID=A0A4R8DHB5_9BACT|nr:hypothetical protein [Dinghuibacter silviterrae]TDW97103.1 hypothetical protein EDB95_4944 [Dinghuibacter silviterrae]